VPGRRAVAAVAAAGPTTSKSEAPESESDTPTQPPPTSASATAGASAQHLKLKFIIQQFQVREMSEGRFKFITPTGLKKNVHRHWQARNQQHAMC
jgi:hypothetical protein